MPLTVQRQSSFAPILPAYTPQFFSYPSLIFSPVVVAPNVHNFPSLIRPSSIALIMRPPMISGSESGFTLVEIVVVVVIISIFAGMISLSVGSSESRKNHAFYEHLTDSLNYVRLLSAERMQPMGLSLQADKQGQVTPIIMTLSNPMCLGYQDYLAQLPRKYPHQAGSGKWMLPYLNCQLVLD